MVVKQPRRSEMEGVLYQVSGKGEEEVIRWGSDQRTRDAARATFDDYKRRGFTLYAMDDDDRRSRRLENFDPSVRGILAIPQMRGG